MSITANRRVSEMATIRTPVLHNYWYMAGWADEFNEGLHERVLLKRSIVIYRKNEGDLVAMQNRCAHRSSPLASGIREGDAIRCAYHGVKFDSDGRMLGAPPGQRQCPRRLSADKGIIAISD